VIRAEIKKELLTCLGCAALGTFLGAVLGVGVYLYRSL
jgi:hypothetical protein